jgi:uncharacterized protein (TIRG00374 family)
VKRTLKFALSVAVTGVCMWWAFKDTDWPGMWASLREANYYWLIPYVGILFGIHLCRTLRWGAYLSGLERLPFRPLNEASGIGFMMLLILPFRLGEFARPFLIAQRSQIRRSAAMTSVVIERIVDGIIIATLLRALMFFVPTETPEVRYVKWAANMMFLIFGGGLAFLLFAVWNQARAVKLIKLTFGAVSQSVAEKVADVVDRFVGATRALPRPGMLLGFVICTAGYWLLNGYGMSLLARAFDCSSASSACVPMSVTVFHGYVVLAVLVVGLMIPAAPGSAGTFQAAVVLGLSIFLPDAVAKSSGKAYANVLWLTQLAQQVLFGLFLMWRSGGSFTDLAGKLSKEGAAADAAVPATVAADEPRARQLRAQAR